MEEQLKEIIGGFIHLSPDEIRESTPINRSVLKGSIVLHRMYAKLADAGIVVNNYQDIDNYGALLRRINGSEAVDGDNFLVQQSIPFSGNGVLASQKVSGIGIDIEEISALPRTHDFREHEFYIMNFSPSELAYCILKADPYASLAGLFAAKEAIVKADSRYRKAVFSSLEIDHLPDGKPVYPGFEISISHSPTAAVAVAVQIEPGQRTDASLQIGNTNTFQKSSGNWPVWVSIVALLIASLAIFLVLNHGLSQ